MIEKISQLRVLTLVAVCVGVVLPVFLCGCESQEAREAKVHFRQAQAHFIAGRYEEAIAVYKKAIDIEPTGGAASLARERISELSTTQPADK